jgi:hypothetical protein
VEGREVARRSGALHTLQDIFHIAIDILPELLQAAAQVVQTWLAVAGADEAVLRTLAVASEEGLALAALSRQIIALGETEFLRSSEKIMREMCFSPMLPSLYSGYT